jgi:uncharacterized protein HemX
MLEQVAELSQQPVTVDAGPDRHLSAVQAYLERRNVNAEESVKPFAKPAANTAQETTP